MLKNKYLWVGVVTGLILGDLLGVKLFKAVSPEPALDTAHATSTAFSLVVTNQMSGDSVVVSNAHVATTTWLAVRESNGDLLGRILGAHRIPPGDSQGVVIELLRPTTANLMYAVVMYTDDGDGSFDNKLDAIVEENGQPILYPFTAN